MNKKFLLLTIFADISKCKTTFSKKNFISFAILILIIIDKYLIIFLHLSIIMKIALYMMFSRLLNNKLIMKFIKISFHDTSDTNKKLNFL